MSLKKYFIGLSLILLATCAHGQNINPYDIDSGGLTIQSIISKMYSNADPNDTLEGGSLTRIASIQAFWQGRVYKNDSGQGINNSMFLKYFHFLKHGASNRRSLTCSNGNWKCIGPDDINTIQCTAYAQCVWASSVDTNYLLAGTWGGLFKTTDGGANWNCITDDNILANGSMYINGIAVSPLSEDTIYLATSSSWILGHLGWGAGVMSQYVGGISLLRSYDKGQTWQQEIIPIQNDFEDSIRRVQKVYFTPDGHRVYAFVENQVYTRKFPVGTWVNITPAGVADLSIFNDLEFVPGDQSHFFISNMFLKEADPHAAIWEATKAEPTSTDWTKITSGFTAIRSNSTTITDNDWERFEMSIPDADSLFFVCSGSASGTNPSYFGLYKYKISGSTGPTLINNAMPVGSGAANNETLELIVSPATTANNNGRHNIYYGHSQMFQSTNDGQSFFTIGTYNTKTHGDIRGIFLQHSTDTKNGRGDRLFIANDGGIAAKQGGVDASVIPTYNTCVNLNGHGLTAGQFYDVAVNEDKGLLLGGMWHDGLAAFEPDQAQQWKNLHMTDASSVMFEEADDSKGYGIVGYGTDRDVTVAGAGRTLNTRTPSTYPLDNDPELNPPVASDIANNHYIGRSQIYNEAAPHISGSPNWFTTFNPSTEPGNAVYQFAIDPIATSFTGYVLYANPTHLYYRNPSVGINSLTQLTLPADYVFTSIAVNTHAMEQIWLSRGFVMDTAYSPSRRSVFYSSNAGTTWTDISNGLPQHLPVMKLAYDEQHNVLYAAMDIGIYFCDLNSYNPAATVSGYNSSVHWECFNAGFPGSPNFPIVYVTNLKINYCQNKIYASTFGRSIWSSDLYIPPSNPIIPTITIASNTTWSESRNLTGSVLIKSGHTLTINGSNTVIHIPKDAFITVEPGAALIVYDARLTNNCDQCFWNGIKALGQVSLSQTTTNQALVDMTNATIEHATTAIENSDGPLAHCGGIVKFYNCKFLNNKRDVYLHEYASGNTTVVKDDKSNFRECIFGRDVNFKGGSALTDHVYLWGVKGIHFYGCDFYNHQTSSNNGTGIGIHSLDATFSLVAHTLGASSTFRRLEEGIWSEKTFSQFTSGMSTTTIAGCDFDSCSYGIKCVSDINTSIRHCTFEIGNGRDVLDYSTCHLNLGLSAYSSSYLTIEENTFSGYTNSSQALDHQNWGCVISNCGVDDKQVYKCIFNNLTRAAYSTGVNRFNDPSHHTPDIQITGLRFLCNTFSGNDNDIYADGGLHNNTGIATYQGTKCNAYNLMCTSAGNTFSSSPTYQLYNNAQDFNYFYESAKAPNTSKVNSIKAYPNWNNTIILSKTTTANTCPTHDGGTTGIMNNSGDKAAYYSLKENTNAAITTYNGLLDGGNTGTLISYINSKSPGDAAEVKTTLLGYSPFLSDTVIKTVGFANILSNAQLVDVLQANPEEVRHPYLLDYLQSSIPSPLTIGDVDEAMLYVDSFTIRSEYESQINMAQVELHRIETAFITEMLADSDQVNIDSLPVWYDNVNNVYAEYDKALLYASHGDYTTANSVLSNIPTKFSLTSDQSNEYSGFMSYWDLIQDVRTDGRNLSQLTSGELATLSGIATMGQPHFIGNGAIKVLGDIGLARDPCGDLFQFAVGPKYGSTQGSNKGNFTRTASVMNAYPNPAKDKVYFDYTSLDNDRIYQLIVSNITGQKVYETNVNGINGKTIWNTQNATPGVYIYKLLDGKKTISTGKISIVR